MTDNTSQELERDKGTEIIVNGRQRTVTQKAISYEQVVALAFDDAFGNADTTYTVTFKRGEGGKPEGSLVAGGSTKVKAGMIFNVTATTRS